MNLLKGSFFLKVSAVVFAVVTYFFIHNEISNTEKEKRVPDPSYKLIKLTTKKLPVNVRLASSPPEGYRILTDKVATEPRELVVVGPEALLEEAHSADTALIDVSESTKTIARRIPLESVAGIPLSGEPYGVEVTVPIEKIIEKKEETKA